MQATESYEISQKKCTLTQLRTSCLFSLRSSGNSHPELHANFRFFSKKNSVVRYDLLNNFHPEHPAFCPSEHHVCFLYVGKSKRTSSRANRNEKLVRYVSFPIYSIVHTIIFVLLLLLSFLVLNAFLALAARQIGRIKNRIY
jgi:hypothetical protein